MKIRFKARVMCAVEDVRRLVRSADYARQARKTPPTATVVGEYVACDAWFEDAIVELDDAGAVGEFGIGERAATAPRVVAESIPKENWLDVGGGRILPLCTACFAIARERYWIV